MQTFIIILIIFAVFIVGYFILRGRYSWTVKKNEYANEYRNKFIEFSNKYFNTYDRYSRSGEIDNSLYVWLTMNSNKIQTDMGLFGVVDYLAAFRTHKVTNYRVILNTIPKYRDGDIKEQDVNLLDNCLLRYLGFIQEMESIALNNLKNPLIWFREGIRTMISVPLLIFNSFGILSNQTVEKITGNLIFNIFSGIIALVTLISGLITIIVGYEQTMTFIREHFLSH